MKYEILYQDLLEQIRNRIPQNAKLVAKLTDILFLEKEAVYRRLRQDVPFTFEEVITIAQELKISLDSMVGVETKATLPFRLQSMEYGTPIEIDYHLLEKYIHILEEVSLDPSGELSSVTNLLPQTLFAGFQYLYHFYYFKWRYYSVPANQTKTYHEIVFPEQLVRIAEAIFIHSKNVRTTHFVLDSHVFQNFVNDVIYFNSIRLIKDEDVLHIKEDLYRFLDYLENMAVKGFVDNALNRVFIYISDTSIDTSFCYINSHSAIRLCLIWSLIFNSVLTFDEKTLEMIKYGLRSVIKTSILISVTGEKQRMLYFEKQRKIVEQL
jgi:hypothetical protein